MEKPDVDSIDGLAGDLDRPEDDLAQPAVDRRHGHRDLRLSPSPLGADREAHCPECGEPIEGQSVEQITDRVMTLDEGTRFMVMAPVVRGRKGEFEKLFEQFRLEGYSRVRVDGELRRLDEEIKLDKKYNHDISVVVDRLVMKTDLRRRLSESIEAAAAPPAAWSRSTSSAASQVAMRPRAKVSTEMTGRRALRARRAPASCRPTSPTGSPSASGSRCLNCGTSIPELEPRIFLQLAARRLRALPRARLPASGGPRSGRAGPDALLSEGGRSRGASDTPATGSASSRPWRRTTGSTPTLPGRSSDEDKEIFLYGTGGERHKVTYTNRFGRRRSYSVRFEGIVNNLERRYEETDSTGSGRGSRATWPSSPARTARAPGCGRRASRSRSAGSRSTTTRAFARAALTWIEKLEMTDTERAIAGSWSARSRSGSPSSRTSAWAT